jgi:hypothetical protein
MKSTGGDVMGYVSEQCNGTGASYQGMPSGLPLKIASDTGFSRCVGGRPRYKFLIET